MSDQQARVVITADASQASREVDAFGTRMRVAGDVVRSSFGNVSGYLTAARAAFVGLGAVVAGSAFVQGVRNQIDLADAMGKAAQRAGMAVASFSEMAYAAQLADIDSETLARSMSRLSTQITKVAAGDRELQPLFERTLKVKVREANGELRATDQILEDLAQRFAEMEDGAVKTALAAQVFGEKAGPKLIPFLNQGKAGIQALREEARQLGIVISSENAQQSEQFNDNMTRLSTAARGVSVMVANELVPWLAKVSEEFLEIVKTEGLARAALIGFGGIVARMLGIDEVSKAEERYKNLKDQIWQLETAIKESERALSANPNNEVARRNIEERTAQLATLRREALETSVALANLQSNSPSRGSAYGGRGFVNPPAAVPSRGSPDPSDFAGGPKPDTRMQGWDAKLDAMKVAHEKMQAESGTFYSFSLQREAEYWKGILDTLASGDSQRFAVQKKYYAALLDIRRRDFEAEQAELQTRIDAAKGNFTEQEALASIYADRAKQRYGADSKEYQQALKQQQQLYRAHAEQLRQIDTIRNDTRMADRLEDIAAMERAAQLERDLGLINQQQLLQIYGQTLAMREQIELQAKQAELAALQGGPHDPVAVERLEAEIAAIRRKYRGLKTENEQGQQVQQAEPFQAIFGVSQQALEEGLTSMVMRMKLTMNGLRDVTRQIGQSMVRELITRPMAEWLVNQARMLTFTIMYGQARVAAEATTAGEIAAINAGLALRNIAASAAEAAANAYKAIAGIPYVGPFLAPVMAGVALAGVLALGKRIFSAEGGFDIPAGMNPMVQAHQREMILPAPISETIRDMVSVYQGGGGQQSAPAPTLNVVKGPRNWLMVEPDNLLEVLEYMKRNNKLGKLLR